MSSQKINIENSSAYYIKSHYKKKLKRIFATHTTKSEFPEIPEHSCCERKINHTRGKGTNNNRRFAKRGRNNKGDVHPCSLTEPVEVKDDILL